MNIKNFQSEFSPVILQRGQRYYELDRVTNVASDQNGNYTFTVAGTSDYTVTASVAADGELSELCCDCPYEWGLCKHIAASLFYLSEHLDSPAPGSSSTGQDSPKSRSDVQTDVRAGDMVRIVPELGSFDGKLKYTLKIGRDKLYAVNDIANLYSAFQNGISKKYGRDLELTHTLDILDMQSAELLELSYEIYKNSGKGKEGKRSFELSGTYAGRFFEIYRDSNVIFNFFVYTVEFIDPADALSLTPAADKSRTLTPGAGMPYFLTEPGVCVFDWKGKAVYVCTGEFKLPEFSARLYLDYNDFKIVDARLTFVYGDKEFTPEESQRQYLYRDVTAEAVCTGLVEQYFLKDFSMYRQPDYYITDDVQLYRLLTEGIPALSQRMELLASDRFSRFGKVRPKVRPAMGIRPVGSMLELELTAEGYSREELLELLAGYRTGQKFRRLKNGDFAMLDESLSELSDIVQSLNLSDKELMKEKIKVPAYRMMYLDNLSKTLPNVRIDRSAEFKKQVASYREMLDSADSITVPKPLDSVLREYQTYGYRWLKTLSAYGFGGILADDMGLGKTLQAIALMLDAKRSGSGVSLVVCPASLMLNWESEIAKFAPELRTLTVMGSAPGRAAGIAEAEHYDVVITSYSLIARDFAEYQGHEFFYQFLDEAQYIKNSSTQMAKAVKSISSRCRFALTGTPVENSFAELWSIFDFIMPDYLFGYKYFREHYEQPIVKESSEAVKQSLQRIVSPFILRRMKADVLTELPEKTETVLLSDMEGEQSRVYSAMVASVKQEVSGSDGGNTEKIKILALLTRLRQICCDPSLVYENYTGNSAKLEQCLELIESCVNSGHKILLFSQFTSMLDIIAGQLGGAGISYFMLTGSTKPAQRLQMVNSFNTDDTNVFLISLKAGGTGLNLTGADVVIHYDPWWNSSAENQASDRAYRMGQKNNVQIYKLITRRTIEEKIRALQLAKSGLADIVLNGGDSSGNIMNMTVEEILELLEP